MKLRRRNQAFSSVLLPLTLALVFLALSPALAETPPAEAPGDEDGVAAPSSAPVTTAPNDVEGAALEGKPFFATTTVTATLTEIDEFEIPMSVSVIEDIEGRPEANTAADLLLVEPGISVNGVGANQTRPIIRGQRGLRVVFLENGLSVNNPRRQSDFGEITGVVDLDEVETVEVLRGPASVLYGSGGIGGVLNIITKDAPVGSGSPFAAGLSLRASSADEQKKGSAFVTGYQGRLGYRLQASMRDADDYEAASGSFGDISLAEESTVFDTGIEDENQRLELRYQLSDRQEVTLASSRYRAEQFGFGFVAPELTDPAFNGTFTRILYPFQDFDRTTLEWSGGGFERGLFNTFQVRLYEQSNERELVFDGDINIGPIFPGAPNSEIRIDTLNFTDLDTTGVRAEATRVAGERQLLTFGVDWTEDDSRNTDSATTAVILRFPFPLPPRPGATCVDTTPPFECIDSVVDPIANTPNAENTSYGVFVQDEIQATDAFKIIAGARYQNVETQALSTPGLDTASLDFEDDELVGSVSLLYALSPHFEVVGSLGSAFRAPSIVERLFNGPTPEGTGFQLLNPALESETSDYYDLGFKFRTRRAYAQLSTFENQIDNGIVQRFLSPAEQAQLPAATREAIARSNADFVVQQANIDQVTFEGVELSGAYRFDNGVSLGGNYTYLDGRRVDSDQPPTGDVAGDIANAWARYQRTRWSVEYRVRHNGEEDAVFTEDDPVPVTGETHPSFTIHTLSAFATVFDSARLSHELGLAIDNLTDELYAEFSNIGAFRPAPKRNLVATYRLRLK